MDLPVAIPPLALQDIEVLKKLSESYKGHPSSSIKPKDDHGHDHDHSSCCGHDHDHSHDHKPDAKATAKPEAPASEQASKGIIGMIFDFIGNIVKGIGKLFGLGKSEETKVSTPPNADLVDIKEASAAKSRSELRSKLSSIYHFPAEKKAEMQNPLLVITKEACPYCKKLEELLKAKDVSHEISDGSIDIADLKTVMNQADSMLPQALPKMDAITMKRLKGEGEDFSYPAVFLVDQNNSEIKYLGGYDDIAALEASGKLDEKLLKKPLTEIFTLNKPACQDKVAELKAKGEPFIERPVDDSNSQNFQRLKDAFPEGNATLPLIIRKPILQTQVV